MRAPRNPRRTWQIVGALIGAHLLIWAWIVWRGITYDWGGFEGLLWWLVAFLVLPAIAAIVLIASWIKGTDARRNHNGE